MRKIDSWSKPIVTQLESHWPENSELRPVVFCDIELGLYLLSQILPHSPASVLWVLLTGYPFPTVETQQWNESQKAMLGHARHLLLAFKNKYHWKRALENYRTLDDRLRIYQIDAQLTQVTLKPVSIASDRLIIYAARLMKVLPYSQKSFKWAKEGLYTFPGQSKPTQVQITSEFIFPVPAGHDLTGKKQRPPINISWTDLLTTAQWMDTRTTGQWYERLNRVRLELFDSHDQLAVAETLTLQGLTNLIGMVSSGKSTLMDVLAVWVARQKLRVTIVVSDVMAVLHRAALFKELGISVAPILGNSNRVKHTARLHQVLATEQSEFSPLEHDHVGFRWLSTACPLEGLREDNVPDFKVDKKPCLDLETEDGVFACPLYSVCPYHQAQIDLVSAQVWLATPASLVYTRVAYQINRENIRFTELVYRCSDLVIIDEADKVQVQLDMAFCPHEILVNHNNSEGWLDKLSHHVNSEISSYGRRQLVMKEVSRWNQVRSTAKQAVDKIYALLLETPLIQEWINQEDYFTDWLLFDKISDMLIENRIKQETVSSLPKVFDDSIEDPFGKKGEHSLADLSRKCNVITDEVLHRQLINWIKKQPEFNQNLPEEEYQKIAIYLHFTLLVSILQDGIDILVRDWKQVELALRLENEGATMLNRPPPDYENVVPTSPMGNVLAFQYIRFSEDPNVSGDLRFLRCMGVGRWWLLHLHELFVGDKISGPHVLLLSGSSWANSSPSYHIQAPVGGILRSPDSEVSAIKNSSFAFTPFYYPKEGIPIFVSGTQGYARLAALDNILQQLTKVSNLGGVSKLEQERNSLPPNRQRVLFVVGSYVEASHVVTSLLRLRPEWQGQIRNLVPDDEVIEPHWRGVESRLQRGIVHEFAATQAWILVAPLLAIERGHNILNEESQAAIGAAYFLIRPHPRPDDISFAIHSINQWAIKHSTEITALKNKHQRDLTTLEGIGDTFREEAYLRWRFLLHLPMKYSTLKPQEREAVIWNQLVVIWQTIGRLIRGGSAAKIYFCDAAFASRSANPAETKSDQVNTSLLVGIQQVLQPYFTAESTVSAKDKILVQTLYGPFYEAIRKTKGIPHV